MTPESTFHPTQKYTLNICVLRGLMMYRKSARGTLFFRGTASTFAMFLHSVPKGNRRLMSDYRSKGHTKLIVNYLKEPRYKFGIKILY